MAKLFYTLSEAAERLKMSEGEVRELVSTGQLQEFRDGEQLMFKVEQVDLLAGDGDEGDDEGFIPLAEDSGTGISLASESGSALGLGEDEAGSGLGFEEEPGGEGSGGGEEPKEQTGVGFFEVDETEQADPSAVTQVAGDEGGFDLGGMGGDAGASGSGLMDLTREADDTSLGEDLLEGLSGGEEVEGIEGGETVAEELFESTESEMDAGAAQPAMALAEVYDGPGSGLAGGLALATIVVLGFASLLVIGGLTSVGGQGAIVDAVGENFTPAVGGMLGVVVIFGLVGWFLGKRS